MTLAEVKRLTVHDARRRADIELALHTDGVLDVSVDTARLPHVVHGSFAEDGRLVAFGLRARARGQVAATDLRTGGLITILRHYAVGGRSMMATSFNTRLIPPEVRRAQSRSFGDADRAIKLVAAGLTKRPPGKRLRGEDAERLRREVAQMYRQLVAAGDRAPREKIAKALRYTPQHVGRLLMQARQRGLLDPALPGRAGEQAQATPPRPTRRDNS